MAEGKRPVVLSQDGKYHEPVPEGAKLDVGYLPVDELAEGLVSQESGNLLETGADGKLKVMQLPSPVSGDEGNLAHPGIDGGVYIGANDILANDGENILKVSPVDKRVTLERATVATLVSDLAPRSLISADEGNSLVPGSDNKLFVKPVKVADLIDSGAELLFVTESGKLSAAIELAYDVNTGKFDLKDRDGKIIGSVTIPSSRSMLDSVELVVNPPNQPEGTYLKLVFLLASGNRTAQYVNMSSFIDVYTAGSGVAISDERVVSVNTSPNGGLNFDSQNRLKVKAADLVAAGEGNALKATGDGKLSVTVPEVKVLSGDTPNLLEAGTDGGVKATYAGLVQSSDKQLLHKSSEGKALLIASHLISTDDGNSLAEGADHRLFVKGITLSEDTPNLLVKGSDDGVKATYESLVKDNARQLLTRAQDGKILLRVENLISSDADNLLAAGKDNRLFVKVVPTGASGQSGNALQTGADGRPYLPLDFGTMQ